MYKLIILFLSFFCPLALRNGYTYAEEQTCISSDGSPNHEIGNFPTRGNPHKFKKQKIKFCFSKNPIKTNKNKYIASVVGVTLTGIPIRPGTVDWYDKNSPRKHSKDKSSGLNLDEIELDLIDFGAEEVFIDEGYIMIYAPFQFFGGLQSELENRNIEIISSGFDRIPNTFKEINEKQKEEVEKLLEKIENDDDVQNVFHTIKF